MFWIRCRTVARLQRGPQREAIRHYVMSGAASAEDVLRVVGLARIAGVQVEGGDGLHGLMPVPLFESIEDLRKRRKFAERSGVHQNIAACWSHGTTRRK